MNHRGFSTIIALTAVGLVAAALSTMAITLRVDKVSTQTETIQAIQRQLLLAAATDTVHRSKDWPADVQPTHWSLGLPDGFAKEKCSVSIQLEKPAATQLAANITATVDGRTVHETIMFSRDQTAWKPGAVKLGTK